MAVVTGLGAGVLGKKGSGADAGTTRVESVVAKGGLVLPKSLSAAVNITTKSRIKDNPYAKRLAEGLSDGDLSEGSETLGKGDDPLSQAITSGTEKAIALSYEEFPEATEATLQVLGEMGEAIDATIEYADVATGNVVSAQWNELDEGTRNRLVGAGKIASVSLSALSVSKLAAIKRKDA